MYFVLAEVHFYDGLAQVEVVPDDMGSQAGVADQIQFNLI
jgi:hypothetical protein